MGQTPQKSWSLTFCRRKARLRTEVERSNYSSEDCLKIFGSRFLAGAVVGFAAAAAHAQAPQVTAIRAGRFFESKSGTVAENQGISVEEDRMTVGGPAVPGA